MLWYISPFVFIKSAKRWLQYDFGDDFINWARWAIPSCNAILSIYTTYIIHITNCIWGCPTSGFHVCSANKGTQFTSTWTIPLFLYGTSTSAPDWEQWSRSLATPSRLLVEEWGLDDGDVAIIIHHHDLISISPCLLYAVKITGRPDYQAISPIYCHILVPSQLVPIVWLTMPNLCSIE